MLQPERRVTMFTGKGGVGKTTCAAATALYHARQGEASLVLSTDPTPSLSDIFEVTDGTHPVQVTDDLSLAELGLADVKRAWDEKFGREVYQIFSSFVDIDYPEFIDFITSVLPGLQEEFLVDHIRNLVDGGTYQAVVWDTAPLGQTLGLLKMPALVREHLRPAAKIYSSLKSAAGTRRSLLDIIKGWEALSAQDVDFLRHGVNFVLVTIPEALAYAQIEGIMREFNEYGFSFSRLVVNNVVKDVSSEFLATRAEEQRVYLDRLHELYHHLEIVELPMLPRQVRGLARLEEVARSLYA
jgi:arsenite/tail-anchored protein-transporting ATPase